MASFARSGETLMQRCLAAHPRVEVVHQIRMPDDKRDVALFKALQTRAARAIPADHPRLAHRSPAPDAVLVLKSAVWCHPHPRRGFALVRNPFSVALSGERHLTDDPARDRRQRRQQGRWAEGIDPGLAQFVVEAPILDGWLALHSRKLLQDRRDGLPFVRYEEFVTDPEPVLRAVLAHMGLPWDDAVLRSHEAYAEGEIGHGLIRLSEPVHPGSAESWRRMAPALQRRVHAVMHEAMTVHGYLWDGGSLTLAKAPGLLR